MQLGLLTSLLVVTALCTSWLTVKARHWILGQQLLDVPNERSLHTTPTPRGGGIALILPVLAVQLVAFGCFDFDLLQGAAWVLVALGFATLGAIDDRFSLSARVRFLVQLMLATMFLIVLMLQRHWTADVLQVVTAGGLVLGIVWIVNLYNFMDGADGLAATQAFAAASIGAWCAADLRLYAISGVAIGIAGASLGFLRWNWQPAKIFLGDVGSYFLGAQFALLAVYTYLAGVTPWFWGILLAPFVVDASLTLCRRILFGEQWHSAHRTHAYQLLVVEGWSHRRVALSMLAIVSLVLGPLAWIAAHNPEEAPYAASAAYGLMAITWAIPSFGYRARWVREHP